MVGTMPSKLVEWRRIICRQRLLQKVRPKQQNGLMSFWSLMSHSNTSVQPAVPHFGETCLNQRCNADIRGLRSPLHGLRFHDLRHHAITELSESQASDQTIMSIAGHVSAKMLGHYSHVRLDAKRKALDDLFGGGSGVGYDKKHDTNSMNHSNATCQAIE